MGKGMRLQWTACEAEWVASSSVFVLSQPPMAWIESAVCVGRLEDLDGKMPQSYPRDFVQVSSRCDTQQGHHVLSLPSLKQPDLPFRPACVANNTFTLGAPCNGSFFVLLARAPGLTPFCVASRGDERLVLQSPRCRVRDDAGRLWQHREVFYTAWRPGGEDACVGTRGAVPEAAEAGVGAVAGADCATRMVAAGLQLRTVVPILPWSEGHLWAHAARDFWLPGELGKPT
mmetsp:Transcript_142838/g.319391  ORF Transcript_142838/g.319391 Transcript_142838/m.319391 type:complete len:230 (+) Transcript_142838:154-843(+)